MEESIVGRLTCLLEKGVPEGAQNSTLLYLARWTLYLQDSSQL
jgi:hypothetical protein